MICFEKTINAYLRLENLCYVGRIFFYINFIQTFNFEGGGGVRGVNERVNSKGKERVKHLEEVFPFPETVTSSHRIDYFIRNCLSKSVKTVN